MAKLDKEASDKGFENALKPKRGITRRDFFKITAAAGAGGGVATLLDWAIVGPKIAAGYDVNDVKKTLSTCPYCAVGCNVIVAGSPSANPTQVVDIYGDLDCPINNGGLCSKGAAAIQLVNNTQRVGVPGSVHTVSDPVSGTAGASGGPMKRTATGAWQAITWDTALTEIATAMVAARGAVPTGAAIATGMPHAVTGQAKGVAFLGCSHATNEENWLYRKLIANFGTNNIEHQARI